MCDVIQPSDKSDSFHTSMRILWSSSLCANIRIESKTEIMLAYKYHKTQALAPAISSAMHKTLGTFFTLSLYHTYKMMLTPSVPYHLNWKIFSRIN